MRSVTLIIDKRPVLSIKYKKLLEGENNTVLITKDLISSIKLIQDTEPDLIIISDSIDNDLSDYCKKIRALTYNMRPIIVATSKSAELDDRLKVLESGADDFISEPVNTKEFVMRMKAHLRREYESNLDIKKLLPNKNYSMRAIKRILSKNEPWACLFISIENFYCYRESYTELASDKLLQTFCAIVFSTLSNEDYIGSFSENEFLIITNQLKAEKIANFLTCAFDSVVSKFYTPEDNKRGYVIMNGDDIAGRRFNFAHTTIGIVTNEFNMYDNPTQLINDLVHIHNMAEMHTKSNYLIERAKITGKNSVYQREINNSVVVYEKDDAMKVLLQTILEIQGCEYTEISGEEDFEKIQKIPAVMIIDAGDEETLSGLDFCQKLRKNNFYNSVKIIVTSSLHDKEKVLNSGADVYLPKPYELQYLIKLVNDFIKEINR